MTGEAQALARAIRELTAVLERARRAGDARSYERLQALIAPLATRLYELAKPVRKATKKRAVSGYVPCVCRDCLEISLGGMCAACEAAGCALNSECQSPDAYGAD